jgi:ubiquinone/menaquinone biosynthesis C-methylase UbiE
MATESNWNSFARVNASQRWRRQAAAMGRAMTDAIVEEAQVERGMRVLDVASGTGEPAISIAVQLQGTGHVVATDVSSEPLKVGQERARERELTNIEFVPADVHQLPFLDASFDRVTCRLGVMFFADLPRALREIHRVLKPDGRASLLAWGPMEQPYFDTTLGIVLRSSPGLRLPASGESMFKFGVPGTLSAAFREAGFERMSEAIREVPWNWPGTPEDLWEWFREVTIPFKPLLQAIPAEQREEVHARVMAALHRHYDGSEVQFVAKIVMGSAARV